MNKELFAIIHAYPLWMKVELTKRRIIELVDELGEDGVYISFSGGKDSTVLMDIVRKIYPNIKGMYIDTGLEYPEVKNFAKSFENIDIVRPKMSFKQVIDKYGYPMISKEQSQFIHQYRNAKSEKTKQTRLYGNKWGQGKISKKWLYMLDSPFLISDQCCNVMKKNPAKAYEKNTGRVPIIGILGVESSLRKTKYIKEGCNSLNSKRPKSQPLGFWKEQDILQYIYDNDLKIASVYGEVVKNQDGTGCVWCGYGSHMEESNNNRFTKLEQTHPNLHKYVIDDLGYKDVLEYMNIKYTNKQEVEICG